MGDVIGALAHVRVQAFVNGVISGFEAEVALLNRNCRDPCSLFASRPLWACHTPCGAVQFVIIADPGGIIVVALLADLPWVVQVV